MYNLQGDVTHILDFNGDIVGEYKYDAWGNITYINGTIAQINPFRYRGYYYDTESGLYYLNSRYYNPEWGRFINADGGIYATDGSVNGYNLFAYCNNNPIIYYDPSGNFSIAALMTTLQAITYIAIGVSFASVSQIDPSTPPDHPDYTPPKKWDGKKVKNPNGFGNGWPSKDGGVWVPTPNMHGGEGWTIQYPGGDHSHAYPGGNVRNHFQREQSMNESVIKVFSGAVFTVVFIVDNITGVGIVDDFLIVGSTSCCVSGINGILGKKVCTECGAIKYGY